MVERSLSIESPTQVKNTGNKILMQLNIFLRAEIFWRYPCALFDVLNYVVFPSPVVSWIRSSNLHSATINKMISDLCLFLFMLITIKCIFKV